MKERNVQLKEALGNMAKPEVVAEVQSIPEYDTTNKEGYGAYTVEDELRLIAMLNTLKVEPQFYRSENETMSELQTLVEKIGSKDPYFLAQCIVYSRCMGEGMRSINHLAAALASPFVAGKEFAKRFYGPFDKKNQRGGCVFRPDDMSEIKDAYDAINSHATLANAMKKGFATAIEKMDTYQLAKYRKSVIDIANLVHPRSSESKATVDVNGEVLKTLDAIMQGKTISADTWEVANSEAGQAVAKAVKDGNLDAKEAEVVLAKAKNDNWEALLSEGKLGILAALRNIRNMLADPCPEIIDMLCELVSNSDLIRKGKIMPHQIDMAYEMVKLVAGCDNIYANYSYNWKVKEISIPESENKVYYEKVLDALCKGYEAAIPNLAEVMPGKTCVMVDCSGSMLELAKTGKSKIASSACSKAGLIAATIAKCANADIVRFGHEAEFFSRTPDIMNMNVIELGHKISETNMGGTDIGSAFELIRRNHKEYDRIILLSDNEANIGCTRHAYGKYIHDVCSPYIYAVDLAAYGTTPLKNSNKVNYYYGYGFSMFDDISSKEFKPEMHIEKIRKVVI